jgi:hypothetical protein
VARALFVLRWTEENRHFPAVRATGEPIVARLEAKLASLPLGAGTGGGGRTGIDPDVGGVAEEAPALRLLARLRELGVRLWAEDGRLCFKAPPGVVTPELRGDLTAHKAELLEFLRNRGGRPGGAPLPNSVCGCSICSNPVVRPTTWRKPFTCRDLCCPPCCGRASKR